jgi:hypothetical protein
MWRRHGVLVISTPISTTDVDAGDVHHRCRRRRSPPPMRTPSLALKQYLHPQACPSIADGLGQSTASCNGSIWLVATLMLSITS